MVRLTKKQLWELAFAINEEPIPTKPFLMAKVCLAEEGWRLTNSPIAWTRDRYGTT